MISAILEFSPQKRVRPIIALQHEFFKELRDPNQRLPNGMPLPHKELFEFDLEEIDTISEAKIAFNGGAGVNQANILQKFFSESSMNDAQIHDRFLELLQPRQLLIQEIPSNQSIPLVAGQ